MWLRPEYSILSSFSGNPRQADLCHTRSHQRVFVLVEICSVMPNVTTIRCMTKPNIGAYSTA